VDLRLKVLMPVALQMQRLRLKGKEVTAVTLLSQVKSKLLVHHAVGNEVHKWIGSSENI
jgi:hypothetical protein